MPAPRQSRRLARNLAQGKVGDTFVSATVVAVDRGTGRVGVEVAAADGSVTLVESVPHASGISPQVGSQVSMTLNGDEPFVVSETGDSFNPVFEGRVTASAFVARDGPNALDSVDAGGVESAWDGWAFVPGDDQGATLAITSDGYLAITVIEDQYPSLRSPVVPLERLGEVYTGFVDIVATNARNERLSAVTVRLLDGNGDVLVTLGDTNYNGEWDDNATDADDSGVEVYRRYPWPLSHGSHPDATSAYVQIDLGAAAAGTITLRRASINTAPILKGGVVEAGDTVISPSGVFVGGGHDLGSPWAVETTASPDVLCGGDWVVRHKIIGKTVSVQCRGVMGSGTPDFTEPLDLPLPVATPRGMILSGALLDQDDRWYLCSAYTAASGTSILRLLHTESGNAGVVNATNPFTWAAGDEIMLAGTYEVD